MSNDSVSSGADISHRGGRPGFIKVDNGRTLIIPDFNGNNYFNTLGNFLNYPKAGLMFIDYKTRDILFLSGTVSILREHPLLDYFEGANRFWQFDFSLGYRARGGYPLATNSAEPSPFNRATGIWAEAEQRFQIAHQR